MIETYQQLNYSQIYGENMQLRIMNAQLRDYFYEQDTDAIGYRLRSDLDPFFDTDDLAAINSITLDQFVYAFIEKICNVYDRQPVFQFEEGVKDEQKARFSALMEEVRIHQVMHENFMRCRLHNTILATVKWAKDLDRMFIEGCYNIGNTFVVEHAEYRYEAALIAYETLTWDNKSRWIVWDREHNEHYATNGLPKWDPESRTVTSDKIPIPPGVGVKAPALWPWTIYHYKLQNDFWGNGLDGIIQLARTINILLTVLADDTVRETIRLLILNFNPAGARGDKGQIKTGLTHPIFPEGKVGNTVAPSGQVLSADLYTDDVLSLIEKLTDIIASMHNVPNPLKSQMTDNLAGVTLRMKNEPLLQQWEKDQGTMRPYDMDLVRRVVEVNNFYRKAKVDPGVLDRMTIVYSDPSIVTDEKAELEIEALKWEKGISSPVDYVQSKHPNMTEKEAEEHIRKNLERWNDLMGMKINVVVPGDEKNLNGNEPGGNDENN